MPLYKYVVYKLRFDMTDNIKSELIQINCGLGGAGIRDQHFFHQR